MVSTQRQRRTRQLLVLVVALAAAVPAASHATSALAGPPARGAPPASVRAAALAPSWADEFSGVAGTAPDAGRWRHDIGGSGWGNSELEYYTNSTRNAALDGQGHLVITARRDDAAQYSCWYGTCQYTSARLLTAGVFSQAYGRFEARIKLPRGQGMWPAFWMLGDNIGSVGWPNSGEIDVMENIGREPGVNHGSLHGPGYSGGGSITGAYTLPNGQAFADAYHTFTVDWSPSSITWYVDGQAYERRTPADAGGNRWVFDHPFFMLLNVAVGGGWPGNPDGSTQFPQQMLIDYVRVYPGTGDGTSGTGPITGIAGKCVDVAGANTANGTPVQLYDCNGTGAQRWTVAADGSIQALGKCMDVTSGSTANGAKVQLYDCNGTGAQKWQAQSNGTLRNPQSGKCLDATDFNSANGTRLQIWDCYGSANQVWHLPV